MYVSNWRPMLIFASLSRLSICRYTSSYYEPGASPGNTNSSNHLTFNPIRLFFNRDKLYSTVLKFKKFVDIVRKQEKIKRTLYFLFPLPSVKLHTFAVILVSKVITLKHCKI